MSTLLQGYAYEAITVAATAIGFTASNLTPGNGGLPARAFCTVEDATIRFRTDGSDPTSTVGHEVTAGKTITVTGLKDMENFRAIRTGGSSASMKVTYER